ncbi:spore coat protein [Brevibacillus gelatini]|uniref:Spore coat protein n=1 Tax=Brevibacillus gelatini TaxID=1655277 RepID=A0A3M8AZL4_9BACL|nr:spore coat protein [Brevibacillus gelatini]RNB56634.1 spore coat protein [Brevibacillus gelatini]
MKMDYVDPANSLNMPEMADMTFAMDFLIRVKEGVRNTATALTETVSPDARALLRTQLHQSIALHQEITDLMVRKKWFHPYDLREQYQLDQLSAENTVEIGKLKLFPDDTRRKSMFDRTPDEHIGGNMA